MGNDWTLFYSTNKAYKVTIIREILSEKDIEVRDVVKNQTTLPVGGIDLYVKNEFAEIAKDIIEKHPEL